MISLIHYIVLSGIIFTTGLILATTRKNSIMILMGIELILNASNINLVAFSRYWDQSSGIMWTMVVIVVAAAEVALALAIILKIYKEFGLSNADDVQELKETES